MTCVFYKFRRNVRLQLHSGSTIFKVPRTYKSVRGAQRALDMILNAKQAA